jgi:tetratricopeptide (TPR) repeat protein
LHFPPSDRYTLPTMKRLLTLILTVLCAASFAAAKDRKPQEAPPTADKQFRDAYVLLSNADEARDGSRYSISIALYRKALDAYIELAEKYPDWQPAVVRFRLTYCDNQLKAILENIKSGKIKLQQDPAAAAARQLARVDLGEALPDARHLMLEDKDTEARKLLLDALRADPDSITVRLLIGIVQCKLRKFDDTVFLLENLVEERPGLGIAHTILGTAYYGLGRTDDARKQMEKALELDKTLKEAHFNLAQIYLTIKPPEFDTAREHYETALALGVPRDKEMDLILKPQVQEVESGDQSPVISDQ